MRRDAVFARVECADVNQPLTAETRYIVLPIRPEGTEGWSEEQLAALVTRNSMIGTGLAQRPDEKTEGS